ncbi:MULTISPECIES: WXG100 family type VII secretion target [unclassified Rhodococcus (in: high G+C Gram-positive bacteria)]|uniref:WXG100 family type VII secretion target n=1 Tax=unclassified Rhodococcus (in: high G+C Gram-positive bacteria) TaxID=192944 RepID=UPI0015C60D8E|nr:MULTISPECIES: WXG100 family type VII secretion target [unclassified Rhodococcus (in: high G+C Gram-positive bacteria)]
MVNFAELDSALVELEAFLGLVEDNLEAIEARTVQHQQHWEGAAAAQYGFAQREWRAGAVEMAAGLMEMRAAAAAARRSYSEASNANLRLLGRGTTG